MIRLLPPLRLSLLSLLSLAGTAALFAGPAKADDVGLTLDQVQVIRTRERDGDRPYLASIVFRSRHNVRGSTSVRVQEREPHDWVAKREHNPAGARGGHLHAGDLRDLPRWMGRHQWNNATIPRLDPRDRSTWEAATRSEVLGALIISIDNNNTPPHVVRGVLDKVAQRMRTILVRQVEGGVIMRGIVADLLAGRSPRLSLSASALTRDLFSDGEKLDLFLGLTIGSTFNPDVVTGIQVVVIPALDGAGSFGTVADQRVTIVPGRGPVTVRTLVAQPSARSVQFTFDSDGADYRVRGRLERAAARPPLTRIDALRVRVDTGGDDLRGGGNAIVRAIGRDGRVLATGSLNRGARIPDHRSRTITLPFRGGARPEDVSHITITLVQGGGISPDNWNVRRVIVHALSGRAATEVFDRAGAPLVRFTGSRPGPISFQPFSGL